MKQTRRAVFIPVRSVGVGEAAKTPGAHELAARSCRAAWQLAARSGLLEPAAGAGAALGTVRAVGFQTESASELANPHLSAHGVKQSLRVVTHAVLKHDCYILDLFDVRGRISLHQYEIRALTLRDGADVALPS
jgi:hypothetical protein